MSLDGEDDGGRGPGGRVVLSLSLDGGVVEVGGPGNRVDLSVFLDGGWWGPGATGSSGPFRQELPQHYPFGPLVRVALPVLRRSCEGHAKR